MPRAARVVAEGVPHYITQRGNNRQHTFLLDKTGGSASARFASSAGNIACRCWATCLMTSHVWDGNAMSLQPDEQFGGCPGSPIF